MEHSHTDITYVFVYVYVRMQVRVCVRITHACMYLMCLCVCMCVNMYVRIGMYGEHTSPSPSHYAIDPFWRRSRQKRLQFSRHKADGTKTMQCATHSMGLFLAAACV